MIDLRKKFQGNKPAQGLAAGAIGALAAALFFLPGLLDRWETKTWDWRVNMLARPSPETPRIKLILLDQNSLDWAKVENGLSWPWPREVYGTILRFCKRTGARALAFDVLFTEPSKYGVADDQALAQEMRSCGNFVGALFLSRDTGSETRWPSFAPVPQFNIRQLDSWLAQTGHQTFPRATFPVPELAAVAGILANVQHSPDFDSVYRRAALFELFDGKVVPSLALGMYLSAQGGAGLTISPGVFAVGDAEVPLDKSGKAILNFRGPSGTHRAYSAASVIQSELQLQAGEKPAIENLADFKDAYVLFGFSAPGLYDLRPTPVSGVYPGVEISATMLDNLLANDFIRPVPAGITVLLTLTICLLAGMGTAWASGIYRSAAVYVLSICVPAALAFAAYRAGYWLPLVVQETGVVVTLFSGGLIYYTTEGRQKAFIKSAFKQYLSPAVIEQIIVHPERLKLGGERRMLSIFFSDLEGFTSISEGLDPEELTRLLNVYLSAMTDIIHEEGGTVDKYEGDAIIAFWNAPLEQPDHAVRCVRAALRCQARLAEMRPDFRKQLNRDLNMRIGINTGLAVVGNMGSHSRFDYTMIGDAVNLAARLEGINKQFGTYTMISRSSMEGMAGEFPVREISRVAVVGRREPVAVYEPLLPANVNEAKKALMSIFAQALALFYEGEFTRALELFSEIAPHDAPARSYVDKCRELVESPPPEWQGVWKITTK